MVAARTASEGADGRFEWAGPKRDVVEIVVTSMREESDEELSG